MLNDYVLPNQSFVACPNQDVAYGLGFFNLDEEPAVVQVPDFGDRFWKDGMIRVTGREANGVMSSPCYQGGQFSCLSTILAW